MNLPDITTYSDVKEMIDVALREDLGPDFIDVTSAAIVPENRSARAHLVVRQNGMLAGTMLAKQVFLQVDPDLEVEVMIEDGTWVRTGDVALVIRGHAGSILTAERTALNFMQRMTGVATLTAEFVKTAANPDVMILDTRKTLPAYRRLDKYSVRCGGGTNHRMGLYDMAMIKDNHLAYWAENHDSGICGAVDAVRARFPDRQVELEVDTIDQLKEGLPAKPDWVLLDNMTLDELRECVALCDGVCKTEASGGVNLETIAGIAQTGVDAISVGALTHSAVAADLALDFV
ncbi:carboxylating nicotinate-nucleotide diphosphorylase [Verrucomicrobiota bacterium]